MKEKLLKLRPHNSFHLSKKFIIISVILLYASCLSSLGAQIFSESSSTQAIQGIISHLLKIACYIILVIIFRKHVEVLLLPSIYSVLQAYRLFWGPFQWSTLLGVVIEISYVTILILALYKNISITVTKSVVVANLAVVIVKAVISIVSYGSDINVLRFLPTILLESAMFIIFFFATKEEYNGEWANWGEIKFAVGVLVAIMVIIALLNNDTTTTYYTYYIDYNGNGKCDWGEAQFYEDKDGTTHWLN